MHREPRKTKGHQKGAGIQLSATLHEAAWVSENPGATWLLGGATSVGHRFLSPETAQRIISEMWCRRSIGPNNSFQRTQARALRGPGPLNSDR